MTLLYSFEYLRGTMKEKTREGYAGVTEFLAKRIAPVFIRIFRIEEEDRDLYYLGIEVIVNTIITAIAVLFVGILLHNFWGALLFLTCFANVRSYSGGYHSKTRIRCFTTTILCYLCTYVVMKGMFCLNDVWQTLIITFGILMTLFAFSRYVPIDNPNKRIMDELRQRNRILAFFWLIVWLFISGFFMFFYKYEPAMQIWATTIVIAVLLWLARRTRCTK